MIKLSISPEAGDDLSEIKEYITHELANPTAGINTVAMITKQIRTLREFPDLGAPLSSTIDIDTDYRFLVCGNYTAFYRHVNDVVYVNRILYNRRNFMKILFGAVEPSP